MYCKYESDRLLFILLTLHMMVNNVENNIDNRHAYVTRLKTIFNDDSYLSVCMMKLSSVVNLFGMPTVCA